jgi:hypothetical protein
MPQAAAILGKALGRPITFVQISIDDVRKGSEDYALMLEWFDRVGYNADIEGLEREFHITPVKFADWASRQPRG